MVLFVTMGVVLTAIGVYEPLVKFAGAGATVPITGFGYSLAKGVEAGVREFGWLGIFTGGLTASRRRCRSYFLRIFILCYIKPENEIRPDISGLILMQPYYFSLRLLIIKNAAPIKMPGIAITRSTNMMLALPLLTATLVSSRFLG